MKRYCTLDHLLLQKTLINYVVAHLPAQARLLVAIARGSVRHKEANCFERRQGSMQTCLELGNQGMSIRVQVASELYDLELAPGMPEHVRGQGLVELLRACSCQRRRTCQGEASCVPRCSRSGCRHRSAGHEQQESSVRSVSSTESASRTRRCRT